MKKTQLIKLNIPVIIKSFLDEDITPADIRLSAAKGLIPLETAEYVTSLYYFLFDSDEEVKSAAKESIKSLPDKILRTYLTLDIPADALEYFAIQHKGDEILLQLIILNKNTSVETFNMLASFVSEKLALMIADNQENILKLPAIIDSLEQNANVHSSLVERLRTFVDMFEATPEETVTPPDDFIEPQEKVEEFEELKLDEVYKQRPSVAVFDDDDFEDYEKPLAPSPSEEELADYSDQEIEELKLNTYQRIQVMSVAEKIQEALKGSRESRSILIKDTNKLVCSAVIKSPKVTENEVLKIANSRSAHEEVIRLITMRNDWLRNYKLKYSLVCNPKTPFKTALKFLNFLRKKDLETIGKSKMIPSQVAQVAKKLAQKRKA